MHCKASCAGDSLALAHGRDQGANCVMPDDKLILALRACLNRQSNLHSKQCVTGIAFERCVHALRQKRYAEKACSVRT